MSFDLLDLHPKCLRVLETQGITEPTPVQAAAIPPSLEGRDLIAVAQTGTGKTLAFALPALTRLSKNPVGRNRMLVLAPTRELASQVHRGIEPFARALNLRTCCVYGGVGMGGQIDSLRRGCDIIVATPGRLIDHLERGTVRFDNLEVLVLDEADRMLDMGFMPAIRFILKGLPAERQTMMFSATFPDDVARLTKEFQRDAQRIEIGRIAATADAVEQNMYTVDSAGKTTLLARLLEDPRVQSAIVFIKTKHRTDRIAKQLTAQGISAQAIHGGRTQGQRERALDGFRKGNFRVLVATDVAARGIDVRGISHVFNFDIPQCYDDYVHRIGRTGRASAKGNAITFVSPEDVKELREIETGLGSLLTRVSWDGEVPVRSLFGAAPRHAQGHHRQGQGRPQGQRPAQRHGQRPERRDSEQRQSQGGHGQGGHGQRSHAASGHEGQQRSQGQRDERPSQGGHAQQKSGPRRTSRRPASR